jgi:hypothetical protein
MSSTRTLKTLVVTGLLVWLVGSTAVVAAVTWRNRIAHAVVGMGVGLILLWVLMGGGLMLLLRPVARRLFQALPLPWPVKFFLFCVFLALVEEAVTTWMTNLAPLFGVAVGEAYITASADYLDVALHHSVIVIVPMFVAWVWLLSKFAFSPFQVFLCMGLTGTLAETLAFGPQHLSEFGLWIFVYGLMVYLPACCLPDRPFARPVRFWHFPLAILLPFLFAIPWGLLVGWVNQGHPNLHFPPIRS